MATSNGASSSAQFIRGTHTVYPTVLVDILMAANCIRGAAGRVPFLERFPLPISTFRLHLSDARLDHGD